MKRMIAAAAVLAVGVSIAVTSIGGAQTSGERTLKFVEKGGKSKFVDVAPKSTKRHPAPSPGDEFVFASPLYDESGARAGFVDVHCAVGVGVSRNDADCIGTAKLKDGTISVAGLSGDSRTTVVAITGGTGAYEGARGSITSIARSGANNAPSDDTVHLLG
jgi:hypothetical protein